MNYNLISTGSKEGNCLIINDVLCLDCGVSYKKLAPHVKNLQLVFISHCHSDHIKIPTIRKLATDRPSLRFAGGPFIAEQFLKAGVQSSQIDVLDAGNRYDYGAFQIEPIELYHDVPCFGLKIYMNDEKSLFATDTGYIDHIEAKDFDWFFLEANHEQAEIEARIAEKQARGEFAYETRAAQTHLSLEQAMDWIARNAGPQSRYVLLHQHKEGEKLK